MAGPAAIKTEEGYEAFPPGTYNKALLIGLNILETSESIGSKCKESIHLEWNSIILLKENSNADITSLLILLKLEFISSSEIKKSSIKWLSSFFVISIRAWSPLTDTSSIILETD